jgi:hypothetical protein
MSPATAGEALHFTVQRFKHGAWNTVARATRPLGTNGAAKISVEASKTGRYRAQASFAGDTTHAPARSAWMSFHVR